MADIAKPQIGKRGWNTAVDAAIDRVNAHERGLIGAGTIVRASSVDPAPSLPTGTEFVWFKTDGAGVVLDILSGVA